MFTSLFSLNINCENKKNEILLSPMTEASIQTDNSTTNWQHKNATKTAITQRLWTDLGRSVGVTTAIQLVRLNQLAGTQPSHLPQKLCNKKDTHLITTKKNYNKFRQAVYMCACLILNINEFAFVIIFDIFCILDDILRKSIPRYESTTLTKLIPVTLVVMLTFFLREEPKLVGSLHCRDLTRDLPTKLALWDVHKFIT